MSRFDAVFLHNVLDYRTSRSHVPDVPDFKILQERLAGAQTDATRLEEGEDLASDIKGIASDYDFDSELSEYVDARVRQFKTSMTVFVVFTGSFTTKTSSRLPVIK